MLEAIIPIILAVVFGFLTLLQFLEKGPVLNNSYLYVSKEDRTKINKKPLYRQSAICFLLITLNFVLSAIAIIADNKIFSYIGLTFLGIAVVYAIASSVYIAMKYGIR